MQLSVRRPFYIALAELLLLHIWSSAWIDYSGHVTYRTLSSLARSNALVSGFALYRVFLPFYEQLLSLFFAISSACIWISISMFLLPTLQSPALEFSSASPHLFLSAFIPPLPIIILTYCSNCSPISCPYLVWKNSFISVGWRLSKV